MRGALGRVQGGLARRWRLHRARAAYVRDLDGLPLLVLPGVLDPVATLVGAWFAGVCAAAARPGERWIDMGTGTGVVGIALARAGARVVAVDVDPTAVRNARGNAALRQVDLEVVHGDLFSALPVPAHPEERADRVAYNVPFWPGDPTGRPFGRAMYAGRDFEAIRSFAAAFPTHAKEAWVVLSERSGDAAAARAALGAAEAIRRERVRGEWLTVFRLSGADPTRP